MLHNGSIFFPLRVAPMRIENNLNEKPSKLNAIYFKSSKLIEVVLVLGRMKYQNICNQTIWMLKINILLLHLKSPNSYW